MNYIENFGGKQSKKTNESDRSGGSYTFTTSDTGTSSYNSDFKSYKMCKLTQSACYKLNNQKKGKCDIQGKCKQFRTESACNDPKNKDCQWR